MPNTIESNDELTTLCTKLKAMEKQWHQLEAMSSLKSKDIRILMETLRRSNVDFDEEDFMLFV